MPNFRIKAYLFFVVAFGISLAGGELYVDYANGKTNGDGTKEKPFLGVDKALIKAQPGDRIVVLPCDKPIRATVSIKNNLKGEEGKPIVIDGGNNIFTGAMPLKNTEWVKDETGLYCCTRKQAASAMSRYFMIHDGVPVRMGRYLKAPESAKFKKPEELQAGEWTIVNTDPANKKPHELKYYLKLPEGETDLSHWEETRKQTGVALSAICSPKTCGHKAGSSDIKCTTFHSGHLVFQNFIVKHYWNDGFGIHGNVRDVKFENCAAVECCDDGISAHENAQIAVSNFVAIRNSTGICHIQKAQATHENVYCEGNLGVDLNPCNGSVISVKNGWFVCDSRRGVVLENADGGKTTLENCLFVGRHPKFGFILKKDAKLQAGGTNRVACSGKLPQQEHIKRIQETSEVKGELAAKRGAFFAGFGKNLKKACREE